MSYQGGGGEGAAEGTDTSCEGIRGRTDKEAKGAIRSLIGRTADEIYSFLRWQKGAGDCLGTVKGMILKVYSSLVVSSLSMPRAYSLTNGSTLILNRSRKQSDFYIQIDQELHGYSWSAKNACLQFPRYPQAPAGRQTG